MDMTSNPEIDFVIANFTSWTRHARKDHADILERANELFVEHGFQPFSDSIVDAISHFESTLASRAQDRMGLDPEDEVEDVSDVIAAWSRREISEGGQDMMVLAAIYGIGPDEFESIMDNCTPDAPTY
jgi:hypothetical protein